MQEWCPICIFLIFKWKFENLNENPGMGVLQLQTVLYVQCMQWNLRIKTTCWTGISWSYLWGGLISQTTQHWKCNMKKFYSCRGSIFVALPELLAITGLLQGWWTSFGTTCTGKWSFIWRWSELGGHKNVSIAQRFNFLLTIWDEEGCSFPLVALPWFLFLAYCQNSHVWNKQTTTKKKQLETCFCLFD